ncbi:hypothetical protein [Flavobacterium covae]|uniref:hypothetical protein n=1 Tax=Flavobacterium covae TaxID=2906076 RepID=UPI000745D527|nr:hypothetical protein [Flavobacterium covae]AMA48984.1 hypothetical protein AWN65_05655 [Flavobacterium covae]MCJ1809903.1 hypothetical protein [Flavobacterium covae]
MALQKEVWEAGIKENPIPNNSFVFASTDKSEFVENNKIHLAEAGIEPDVHENYFAGSETDLPLASITDIPNEVVLNTYSTDRTRHRDLQECELQYNKRMSILNRHKNALAKNLGVRAAFAWTPAATNAYNKVITLGAGSILDAIIDLQAFYAELDKTEGLNICLTPKDMAKIRKENKVLYKEILAEGTIYGFKVFQYTKNPLFTSEGVKKPFGSVKEAGDLQASFTWATDETFRCFGDVKMYETLATAASQADEMSFAQRALVGNIRATTPKYLGAIIS